MSAVCQKRCEKALLGTVAMQTEVFTLPMNKRLTKMAREARHFLDEAFFAGSVNT